MKYYGDKERKDYKIDKAAVVQCALGFMTL